MFYENKEVKFLKSIKGTIADQMDGDWITG